MSPTMEAAVSLCEATGCAPALATFGVVEAILVIAVGVTLSLTLASMSNKAPPPSPDAFEIPSTEEGEVIGWVFGTPDIVPLVSWWGDRAVDEVQAKGGK